MSFSWAWPALRRCLEAAVTLVVLAAFCFLLLRALPGGPFDDDEIRSPEVRARLTRDWGLEGSWREQLGAYFSGIFSGDLGRSMLEPEKTVASVLSEGLSRTLALNALALLVIVVGGFSLAVLFESSGPRARAVIDAVTTALVSLPSLFLGPLLIWLFAMKLDLLPIAFLDGPEHYLLPVLTLSLRPSAYLCRLVAASLADAKGADYMRTAKAKGLSLRQALWRHALRNSLVPILGYLGPLIVGLLSGSFMVEILFSIDGLGRAFVEALGVRDYPIVMGLTLFYGFLLILVSLVLDLVMRAVDPRLREVP